MMKRERTMTTRMGMVRLFTLYLGIETSANGFAL